MDTKLTQKLRLGEAAIEPAVAGLRLHAHSRRRRPGPDAGADAASDPSLLPFLPNAHLPAIAND